MPFLGFMTWVSEGSDQSAMTLEKEKYFELSCQGTVFTSLVHNASPYGILIHIHTHLSKSIFLSPKYGVNLLPALKVDGEKNYILYI